MCDSPTAIASIHLQVTSHDTVARNIARKWWWRVGNRRRNFPTPTGYNCTGPCKKYSKNCSATIKNANSKKYKSGLYYTGCCSINLYTTEINYQTANCKMATYSPHQKRVELGPRSLVLAICTQRYRTRYIVQALQGRPWIVERSSFRPPWKWLCLNHRLHQGEGTTRRVKIGIRMPDKGLQTSTIWRH